MSDLLAIVIVCISAMWLKLYPLTLKSSITFSKNYTNNTLLYYYIIQMWHMDNIDYQKKTNLTSDFIKN